MNFASEFVYEEISEENYEVVSDEEFLEGMDLSDSGSDDDEGPMSEEQSDAAPAPKADAASTSPPRPAKPPSMLGRFMGMLTSSVGGSSTSDDAPPPPLPSRSKGKPSKMHHWKSQDSKPTSAIGSEKKKRRVFRRADTNIVSLRFDTLKAPSTMHAGEVIQCSSCEAIMSHISNIEEDGPDKVWKCEFCENRNVVDIEEEEKPTAEDVTYLVEAGLTTAACGTSGRDESIVIFCVDISGSMTITTEIPGHQKLRGSATLRRLRRENTLEGPQRLPGEGRNVTYISRLQAVQAAVDHQLGEMMKEFPHRRVGLVTFSSDVRVLGDGTGEEVTVSGSKLMDREELIKVGEQLPTPKPIKEVRASLGEKVFALEEGGATALGPAIIIALSLASRHPGSKVILCTDGKSNEGVGKVENLQESDSSPDEFFDSVASTANDKGVSVSVVTISGTDCKLIHLGKLADSTRGQVNIVDPLKLTEEFSNVLADRIIATSVVATFILHKGLYIGKEENESCKERKEVGNVHADHEISFEFGVRKRKTKRKDPPKPNPLARISEVSTSLEENPHSVLSRHTGDNQTQAASGAEAGSNSGLEGQSSSEEHIPSELPFQLQINYTDVDGTKALRVLTQKKPVTNDRNVAEKDVDFNVLGLHTERRSSELALEGDYTGSRAVALMNQRLGWRSSHSNSDDHKRKMYRQAFSRVRTVENTVSSKQRQEMMSYGRTHSDDEDDQEVEQCDLEEMAIVPPVPPLPRPSGPAPYSKRLKMKKTRSEEVHDQMAHILYQARSSSSSNYTAVKPSKPSVPMAPLPKASSSKPPAPKASPAMDQAPKASASTVPASKASASKDEASASNEASASKTEEASEASVSKDAPSGDVSKEASKDEASKD